jgi:hypothetical protein
MTIADDRRLTGQIADLAVLDFQDFASLRLFWQGGGR